MRGQAGARARPRGCPPPAWRALAGSPAACRAALSPSPAERACRHACMGRPLAGGRRTVATFELGAALPGDLAHEADCAGAQVERDVVPGADGRACGPRRRVARLPACGRNWGAWRALTCQAPDEQAVLERARLALRRAVQRAQPSMLRSFSRRGGCAGGHGCSHAPHAAHLHPGTTSWPACRCGRQGEPA